MNKIEYSVNKRKLMAFQTTLAVELHNLREHYDWIKSTPDIENYVRKLTAAVPSRGYYIQGQGILNALEVLGIKTSYKDIEVYLDLQENYEPSEERVKI